MKSIEDLEKLKREESNDNKQFFENCKKVITTII